MASKGIEGFLVETRNFGKTVAFWEGLGFKLQFETDHGSGQLVHPDGGPFVFVAERQGDQPLDAYPVVAVADSAAFTPPAAGTVEHEFTPQHWDVTEMMLVDPDGRHVSVQAPLPEGVEAPARHA